MSDNATRKRRGRPPTLEGTPGTYTVRLPENLVQALERFAESEKLSRSDVIRMAIADYLKRKRALPKD
jgi:predicted transcriptional regulator